MHHWQVVGNRFVQMGDHSLIRQWPVSRLKENFACALAKCFFIFFFFFLRAIGYLMIEKTYKVAIRDAGAYFYKRLVSKNGKLKDLAHIFYYHLTRFPYFWRDGSRAKRIVELIELLCFDRSKRARHVLISLPFYLCSLILLIFFPSPPQNHSLSINIPNRDDRFFYSLNVRHVTNSIFSPPLGITIRLFRFFSPFSRF